jgi:caspase domain-containing protein
VKTNDSRDRWAALLVGAAANEADLPELPSVRNNLADLYRVLTDPQLVGMDPANVTVVADPAAEHEVLDPLSALAKRDLDVLLVYYAGHGQTDDWGNLYLATTRTPNLADNLTWRSVQFERMQGVIRRAVAGVRLIVLDCCFAGRALDVMAGDEAVLRGAVGTAGAVTWVASPATQTAMAPASERHTAFTGAMLGHVTGDTRTPGTDVLTLDTLVRSTRATLRALGRPQPQVQVQGTGLDLPIVRRPPLPVTEPELRPEPARLPRQPTPRRSIVLPSDTPELTAALKRRIGTRLAVPDEDVVSKYPLPTRLRSSWGRTARTHSRAWQKRLPEFPSAASTTWQLHVELIGDHERELFHLALMTEAVGGTTALRNPAGRLGPAQEESIRDFFWLNIDADGLITPDKFNVELTSRAHFPYTLWVRLPPTVELFERDGIRTVADAGERLGLATLR